MNAVATKRVVLYSFRRCPYAIRTRMVLLYAGVDLELREISFKNKPQSMLLASPKGTVPVLLFDDASVLDESRDIMLWALNESDPQAWYFGLSRPAQTEISTLIDECDGEFKHWLDRYKYSVAHPEHTPDYYRTKGELFLSVLENRLEGHEYLFGEQRCLADIAIFPFVRQFAFVDKANFDESRFSNLKVWLALFISDPSFTDVMGKHSLWQEDEVNTAT